MKKCDARKKWLCIICIILFVLSIYSQQNKEQSKGSDTKHDPKSPGEEGTESIDIGKQYLVLIAIDNYKYWLPISGPVKEARKLNEVISYRYYMDEIIELYNENATKSKIIKLFRDLQNRLKVNDSLLIFFSGHGHLDESSNNGFWISVNGGLDENKMENWIPNSVIRGLVSNIKAKHILLISDSCYSGELLNIYKGTKLTKINNEYLKKAFSRRCRQVLTSSASERVPTSSEFAHQLILALKENTKPCIDGLMLFNEIKLGVKETMPLFGELKGTHHQEGAVFLFFLKGSFAFGEELNQKAKNIYKNEKGFWEAEFDYEIVVVYIPKGEFTMGSNDGDSDEKPAHKIYLDGYWIGKYEVTFDQYDQYCNENNIIKPDDEGWSRRKMPVINVSWNDALEYTKWISRKIGLTFRLPTEAEWEKAARGNNGRKYPWGNTFFNNGRACYNQEGTRSKSIGFYTSSVSPYGLLDMSGNVWEWCLDWYSEKFYTNSPTRNPNGPFSGSKRVARGGSWKDTIESLRCSNRNKASPIARNNALGFRLCLDIKKKY